MFFRLTACKLKSFGPKETSNKKSVQKRNVREARGGISKDIIRILIGGRFHNNNDNNNNNIRILTQQEMHAASATGDMSNGGEKNTKRHAAMGEKETGS